MTAEVLGENPNWGKEGVVQYPAHEGAESPQPAETPAVSDERQARIDAAREHIQQLAKASFEQAHAGQPQAEVTPLPPAQPAEQPPTPGQQAA